MANQKTDIKDVIFETVPQDREDKYNDYVDEHTPKVSWLWNLIKAFFVGGVICVIGQALISLYMYLGFDKDTSALYNTISLIFLSVLLTGFNIYPKLANFAGAGTLVPITGFANSVAAPAIEFKKDPADIICTKTWKPLFMGGLEVLEQNYIMRSTIFLLVKMCNS